MLKGWMPGGAILALVLLLGGCGGKGSLPLEDREQGFSLRLDPASAYGGGEAGELKLAATRAKDALELRIETEGARDLKALYVELDYDPSVYAPASSEPLGPFSGASGLSLAVDLAPGKLVWGQVLVHPQAAAGFSGSGPLAVLRFARQPYAGQVRHISAPPLTAGSAAPLRFLGATGELVWNYANQGDYDQNSETNIADLTPLALHFGATAPGGPGERFPLSSVESQIDGDNNGEINLADLTPIGQNFGAAVESWAIFSSPSQSDYAATAATPSAIAALASQPFGSALGDPAADRLEYRFTVPAPTDGDYYWVRPLQSSSEGTPSEMDGDNVIVIAPNVRIVDGNPGDTPGDPGGTAYGGEFSLNSHSLDFSQVDVTDPPGGETIAPGDIIVGFSYDGGGPDPDGGFLRHVTAVSPGVGDSLILETTDDASLHDVFLKGGFRRPSEDLTGGLIDDLTGTLPHAGCGSSTLSASGLRTASAGLISFNADGTVLVDKHDGPSFYTVTLPQANFSFGPDFDVDVDFDTFLGIPYDLNSFHAIASGGLTANLEVLTDAEYHTTFNEEKLLYHVSKDQYFLVGPVPVLLTFTLDVYGGVEGNADASFHSRFGFNLDYEVALGVKWDEDDGWSTVHDTTNDSSTIGPELKMQGEAHATVYLRPEAGVALYHSIGAIIKVKPYLHGDIDGSFELGVQPFCAHWNLDGGIGAQFGIYGKILGISLFDETFDLFDYSFDITEGQLGCVSGPQAPVAGFSFGPTYVIDDIGPWVVNFDAGYVPPAPPFPAGGSYDPDGVTGPTPNGIKFYEWDFDGDGIIDLCTTDPTGSFTYLQKFHNYNATLWVTDEEGMVSSLTQTVYIDDPIG